MSHRNAQRDQQQQRIRQRTRDCTDVDFFNLLTGPELLEITESLLPDHRERLYPPTVTLSMFIKQVTVDTRTGLQPDSFDDGPGGSRSGCKSSPVEL